MGPESLSDAFAPDGPGDEWTPGWLRRARQRPNTRRSLLVAAALVGLVFAWIHWLGLVAGGVLVGGASRSVRAAVLAGLGFGAFVLAVHVVASPVMGPVELLGLTPVSVLTVAAGLVAPLWGSLVRAIV